MKCANLILSAAVIALVGCRTNDNRTFLTLSGTAGAVYVVDSVKSTGSAEQSAGKDYGRAFSGNDAAVKVVPVP